MSNHGGKALRSSPGEVREVRRGDSDQHDNPYGEAERMLRVHVLYQESASRSCAQSLSERLSQRLGPEALRSTWCRFDALADSAGFERSLAAATRSHIVMLALRGADALPEHVQSWLEAWASQHAEAEVALVALYTCSGGQTLGQPPADASLKTVLHGQGVEYFPHFVSLPSEPELYPWEHGDERHHAMTPTLRRIMERPVGGLHRFEGLNE